MSVQGYSAISRDWLGGVGLGGVSSEHTANFESLGTSMANDISMACPTTS
jgi:hypothetical protein